MADFARLNNLKLSKSYSRWNFKHSRRYRDKKGKMLKKKQKKRKKSRKKRQSRSKKRPKSLQISVMLLFKH